MECEDGPVTVQVVKSRLLERSMKSKNRQEVRSFFKFISNSEYPHMLESEPRHTRCKNKWITGSSLKDLTDY